MSAHVTTNPSYSTATSWATQSNNERPHLLYSPIKSVNSLIKQLLPNPVDTIGNFQLKASLHLKEGAEVIIDAPWKCSVYRMPKVEAVINKMEDAGVMRKVTHTTPTGVHVASLLPA